MTVKELAARLDGREYREVPDAEDRRIANESGLVVIYGASDDLFEIDGALHAERGDFEGGVFYLARFGLVEMPVGMDCGDYSCPAYQRLSKELTIRQTAALKITAVWHDEGNPCWTYKLESTRDIPHEMFRIMEDGEVYCEGVVLRLEDLPEGTPDGTVSVDGVEYAPVRRALWRLYEGEYECTACGEKYYKEAMDAIGPNNDAPPPFCPHCGARMDAEHY